MEKGQHAVDAEFLPGLEDEGLPPHGRGVHVLALPVVECRLDDADYEIRVVGPVVQVRALPEFQEAPGGQLEILPGDDGPVQDAVHVGHDLRLILPAGLPFIQ